MDVKYKVLRMKLPGAGNYEIHVRYNLAKIQNAKI